MCTKTFNLLCSIALVRFTCQPDAQFILVGVARNLKLRPREIDGGAIYTYHLAPTGDKLQLVHKTMVEEVPGAMIPFRGLALIGIGRLLRVYDLGKRKLLRKSENKVGAFSARLRALLVVALNF